MSPNSKARPPYPDPLAVVERGLAVFPIPRGAKKATLPDWPNRCVSDPDYIRRAWPVGSNIGVGCKANNIVGLDLDRHHEDADGVATFTQLCEAHGQSWPRTFTVQTPSGGLHLYYRAPAGRSFGNTAGKVLGPGVDTRGPGRGSGGGYLVGPGSIVDGQAYVVVRDMAIQMLPGWLADLLDPPAPTTEPAPVPVQRVHTAGSKTGAAPRGSESAPVHRDRWVIAAVQGESQKILETPPGRKGQEGGRNEQLNRSAFVLGGLIGAGVLDRTYAEEALTAAACAVGLDKDPNCGPRQIAITINSGLNAGISKPRIIRGAR